MKIEELDSLPVGVTPAEWSLERQRWQNPRIRTLLGCITLIAGVLESNYAILHCSPDRLYDIWQRVREVSRLMSQKLRPLLAEASTIPALEEERQVAETGLDMLTWNVLDGLDEDPDLDTPEGLLSLRKQLCVAIGQIHGYLQDTFGRMMAADPRSLHDSDYYLSQRFPLDIEEAEWLHSTVKGLRLYLVEEIEPVRQGELSDFVQHLRRATEESPPLEWDRFLSLLTSVTDVLIEKLKEILALRGIRFGEMEVLDRYTEQIPQNVRIAWVLNETRVELKVLGPQKGTEALLLRRIEQILRDVDSALLDLTSFVPLWLASIEERRALLLRQH